MMKRLAEFLKTTALGGLFVILPVLLLYLLLAEAIDLIIMVATPIADLFPAGTFDHLEFPGVIALLLILSVSFLFGLGIRSRTGRSAGLWFERVILGRLPAYTAIKRLTTGFLEAGEKGVRAAVLTNSEDEREIVYLIEDHGDGEVTVLQPWAPAAFAGSIKIVSRERIKILDSNLGDVSMIMSHWGVGALDLLGKDSSSDAEGKQKNG
jgi:uncharacterized membrane protein